MMKKRNEHFKPRSFIGLMLIVLAVLLLLNNVGFKLVGVLLSHWPLILIGVGGYLFYSNSKAQEGDQRLGMLPYILVGVGLVTAFSRYGLLHFSIGALIWPLILLLIGLKLFRPDSHFCKYKHQKESESNEDNNVNLEVISDETRKAFSNSKSSGKSSDGDPSIDVFAILGGGNYSTRSQSLSEGNILCLLGGAEIDLSEADTKQDVIEIDILAFMGGAELRIPPHWRVTVKAIPFMGGVSNKTTCLADKIGVPEKQLIITGFACMGGIEVKN